MKRLGCLIYLTFILILVSSIVKSVYYYRFDNDELFHVQKIFLLAQGFKPYLDFYSIYSPFLHLTLLPIFLIFGFSIKTISYAKIAMIVIFFLRTILSLLFINIIFGKKVAIWFLPLLLLEPFTILVGMQIRPENFMILFYVLSLYVFSTALIKSSKKLIFISGFLFAITLVSSIKIFPGIGAIVISYFIFCAVRKTLENFLFFFDGFIAAILIIFGYFVINGTLPQAFQQIFLDPFIFNESTVNPTPINFFYMIESSLLYGELGKPVTWIYSMLLPIIAFAGGYKAFNTAIANKFSDVKTNFSFALYFSMFAIRVSMMFINSVWMQYYIPLTWLYCLFTAYFINDILKNSNIHILFRRIFFILIITFLLCTAKISYSGNILRTYAKETSELTTVQQFWEIIPANERTFSNLLFRKPAYPIIYGAAYAPYRLQRFGPIYKSIEKFQLKTLVVSDDLFNIIDPETQIYIKSHYQRDLQNPIIWSFIKSP